MFFSSQPKSTLEVKGFVYTLPFSLENEKNKPGHDHKLIIAKLGQKECYHFIRNQREIPVEIRQKISIIFQEYKNPKDDTQVAFVYWEETQLIQNWIKNIHFWNPPGYMHCTTKA